MTDWTDSLPMIDMDRLGSVFGELVQVDAGRELAADQRFVRKTDKRVLLDGRRLANALEHIGRLPEDGEAFHLITSKKYSLFDIIKATLHLAAPARLRFLAICTLGFSTSNVQELIQLIDAGQVERVQMLYSVFHKSNEKELCQWLTRELIGRGHQVLAALSHAKLLLMRTSDDRHYVVESSANLRSCSSVENIMLVNDHDLFDFHAKWINELMEGKT
jgi:hypothetical protein